MYVLRFIHIYYLPFTICIFKCGAALSQLLLLRGAAVGQHLECGLALGMGERSACGAERESLRLRSGSITTMHHNALLSTKSLLYPRPMEPERLERARNRRQEFKIDFEALAAIKKRLVILLTL